MDDLKVELNASRMLWLSVGVAVLCALWLVAGCRMGRAEMKLWQDAYYQRHPVVDYNPDGLQRETSVKDDGTLIIYGDNLPNSCEQKIGHMECSYKIVARPAPAPKPPKASKQYVPECKPPNCSPVDTTIPLYCEDGQILPNNGPCPRILPPAEQPRPSLPDCNANRENQPPCNPVILENSQP